MDSEAIKLHKNNANNWNVPAINREIDVKFIDNSLHISCDIDKNNKYYIVSDSKGFAKPPLKDNLYSITPNTYYRLCLDLEIVESMPQIQLWVIEYSDDERIQHSNAILKNGTNEIVFLSSNKSKSFKIAFRLSSKGKANISNLVLSKIDKEIVFEPDYTLLKRDKMLPSYEMYEGENLVFIVGAPRSGTTWLLNLLSENQDVTAATEENLNIVIKPRPTLETNIFNPNRSFSDEEIKEKFYNLSSNNLGKVIVEKTPVHLLYVDRIKNIFPKAAIVLIERDGRDVVTSLLEVGRDPNAWWKGAPKVFDKAVVLWKKYAIKAQQIKKDKTISYYIKYEALLDDTEKELNYLYQSLGISQCTSQQIVACEKGKKIPIKGVFREGKAQGWKRYFLAEDINIFKHIGGYLLIESGYEKNNLWR
jgi:hypothetical protein